MDSDHVLLFGGLVFFNLLCTFGLMILFGRWLVKNTRPKYGHCPRTCICRKAGYVWPNRRVADHDRRSQ